MIRIESTDHFSDEGLMALHMIYSEQIRKKYDYTLKIKEAAHYRSVLLRVPLRFAWELEKTLLDLDIEPSP